MSLRTSILRRLVAKNPILATICLDIADCDVTSRAFGAKKINVLENSSKIRLLSELQETYTKDST